MSLVITESKTHSPNVVSIFHLPLHPHSLPPSILLCPGRWEADFWEQHQQPHLSLTSGCSYRGSTCKSWRAELGEQIQDIHYPGSFLCLLQLDFSALHRVIPSLSISQMLSLSISFSLSLSWPLQGDCVHCPGTLWVLPHPISLPYTLSISL